MLAQIGKNYGIDSGIHITGDELIGYADDIMADIQHRIGGGVIYLDCEDKQHLKNFYVEKNIIRFLVKGFPILTVYVICKWYAFFDNEKAARHEENTFIKVKKILLSTKRKPYYNRCLRRK